MDARYLALFLLILLTAAAAAQPVPDQKSAVVEGTVSDSVTGTPLRKVELTLANSQVPVDKTAAKTFTTTTDAGGKFRIERIDPGTYWLTAKHAGFVDGQIATRGGSIHLAPGEEVNQLEIRLVKLGSVVGRILDEDGEPVSGASVSAQHYVYARGRQRLVPADFGRTDDRGEFRLANLPPGHYYLFAELQHSNPTGAVPEIAYVATYYPNSLDPAQASKVDVAAGGELTGFNIRLRKSRVVRVRGTVVGPDGEPLKNAQIMLLGGDGHASSKSMTPVRGPEGQFEFTDVQPGLYTIMTVQMEGSGPKIFVQPLVVGSQNLDNLKLGGQPPADGSLQGKIVVDSDARLTLKGVVVQLTAPGSTPVMPASGTADENGMFAVSHVINTQYDVAIFPVPRGAYVKSLMFNGQETLGRELDCTAAAGGVLNIVLGTDGGNVEGTVSRAVSRQDKPAAGSTVVLLPADPARRFPEAVRVGWSDASGHYTLKDVPPGDYLAFAWERVEIDAWYDPDFLKPVEGSAVKVKVGPRSSEHAQLSLIPSF